MAKPTIFIRNNDALSLPLFSLHMIRTIVVAASENNVIGVNNTLPWHLPDDLRFFKKVTLGKPVLMGRKTFESLGRPLPKRLNIVLSGSAITLPEGVLHFTTYQAAISYLEQQQAEEVCIIGGGVVFSSVLDEADQVFLTRVHTRLSGEAVFFPELKPDQWEKVWEEEHPADDQHHFSFTFEQYKRKGG